jgi:hypothetical protein
MSTASRRMSHWSALSAQGSRFGARLPALSGVEGELVVWSLGFPRVRVSGPNEAFVLL